MTANFEETLISVWRQALVEDCKTVMLEGVHYPVRLTSRSKLREVNFRFEEQTLRGLEQNPNTNSRWAQLAREGKKEQWTRCEWSDLGTEEPKVGRPL
jgi:hypothetical protein